MIVQTGNRPRCCVQNSQCPLSPHSDQPPKRKFRIVVVQALGRRKGYLALDVTRGPQVCIKTWTQQTAGGSEGGTCSHTLPSPFGLLLQFKAGASTASTMPRAPPSIHWAGTK